MQQQMFANDLKTKIESKEAMMKHLRTNISKQTRDVITLANELIELRKLQRREQLRKELR